MDISLDVRPLADGVLHSIVYGVSASDPLAIGGAVIAFMLVAVAAALVPARRAARSDPSAAFETGMTAVAR
jgi:ABC-type antimicrobial peptide transport system permease subunit